MFGSPNPNKGFSSRPLPFASTLDFIICTATSLTSQGKYGDVTTLFEKSIEKAKDHRQHLKEFLIRIREFYIKSLQYHELIKYLLKLKEILDPDRESEQLADILYDIGVTYFKVWDCNNAINYLERSLDLSSKLNYHAREAGCYCNLGNANLRSLNTPSAIKFYKKALNIFLKIDDKRGVANNYLNLGNAYLVQKQFEESTNFSKKALVISCQIGHVSGKEKAFICLGEVCIKEEQYEKAIGYFEKALDVNKVTLDKIIERQCYVSLGDAYFSQKQFQKAAEYFQKNYRLLINSSPPTVLRVPSQVDNLPKKGLMEITLKVMTCLSLGQSDIAIDYLTKSVKVCLETSNLSQAGIVYVGLGDAYVMLKEYEKAKANFSEAVAIFEKLENREVEASALIGLGNVYNCTQNFPEAIKCHSKAMNIGIEIQNVKIEGIAHESLGNAYVGLRDYKRANEHHLISLKVAIDIGDQTELADIYENRGTAYLWISNYSEAKDCYEKALSINEKMRIRKRIGTTYGNLATVYSSLNHYKKSIKFSAKSLAVSIELGDAALEAKAYGNLGGVNYEQGKLSVAIDYHEKEAEICRKISDRQQLASANINLGNAYQKIGNPQKAINSYMESISISKQLGHRASLALSLTNLGVVYNSLGRFESAIRCLGDGCNFAIECGNRASESSAYCHLGNAYNSLGKYKDAMLFYKKHHDISVQLGNLIEKSEALANLANVYRSLGEYHKAIDYCEQALTIALEVGRPSVIIKQYSNLAGTYEKLGNYEKAVEFYKKSCDASSAMGDKQHEACCNASIGSCYLVTAIYDAINDAIAGNKTIKTRLSEPISLLKKAIRSMDNILSELVADRDQTSAYNQYYQLHINLAFGYFVSEKTVNGLLVLDIGKSKALQLWIEGRGSPASEHASANSYRDETWEMIERENGDTRVKDIAELLKIQERDATVLVYALDFVKMLHIWVISSDGSYHHKVMQEATKDWLLKETKSLFKDVMVDVRGAYSFFEFSNVRLLNDDVPHRISPDLPSSCSVAHQQTRSKTNPTSSTATEETPPENDTSTADNVSDPRKKLYQALIGPVKNLIKGTNLIIVPDTCLFFVPFCSLLNESGRPLVNDYSIQMTPSLHTLASIVLASKEQSLTDPGPALFVGNPFVGEITFRGKLKELHPLPAAGEEAKSLATKFDSKALVENQATKKRVLERVCDASIVHIAAHGEPDNGEIFLAPNPEAKIPGGPLPTEKSYLLRQGDVINCKLTARLVVLSCCYTGRGEVTSEGVLGLARAFLAAGARSALVALWPLPDRETKVFMEHFYDELCNGKTTCKALKASMNMFCQSSDENRRCFRTWAPFTIFGEDVIFTKNDIDIIKEQSRKMAK